MLLGGYIKLAIDSMRSSRWRSLLTMLGIIVGIVAVVTTVSLGEGVKQQIVEQINHRGEDLLTVLPGEVKAQSGTAYFTQFNMTPARGGVTAFSETDYQAVNATKQLSSVAPFGRVTGEVMSDKTLFSDFEVVATSDDLPGLLKQDLEFGTFFTNEGDPRVNSAVIGRSVAERMFGENAPLGRDFSVRGTRFIVRGVFEEFNDGSPLLSLHDYDNTIFISHRLGQELMGGTMQIYQILARPDNPEQTSSAIDATRQALKKARNGAEDFTVLRQSETLQLAEETLTLLTSMIAGVAAISLIVGGIGIMNIMLVSVTERTREIGVRKAVGATNRQVLYQFMTEAAVLSIIGGFLGILTSIAVNFVLRISTELQPVITLPVMGVAVGVSLIVGLVFGVAPAAVAARKDPIESLRYE